MPSVSFSINSARSSQQPVLAFDLGGTWFRCGLVTGTGDVELLDKSTSSNIWNCNRSPELAQEKLIRYVTETTKRYLLRSRTPLVGVSIGAAVNMNTGRIIASAPLWGAYECDLDLFKIFSHIVPEATWSVLNDVTALAMRLVASSALQEHSFAAALTISSGIAYRTIDLQTGKIPADPEYGLQGEIGHLPTEVTWRGKRLDAQCDCGQSNHVSAFSSGRAIESLLHSIPELAKLIDVPGRTESKISRDRTEVSHLSQLIASEHSIAMEFLNLVTMPLAKTLIYQMTLNPQVTFTSISGGVPEGLGKPYFSALMRQIQSIGLYGVPVDAREYFFQRIGTGSQDGLDALRGVAVYARGAAGR